MTRRNFNLLPALLPAAALRVAPQTGTTIAGRLITNKQFPSIAREQFGIEGLKFVNTRMEPPIAGYKGYIGIEYEGERLTEFEGIQGGRRFLRKYV